jgi:hypothetical protein
MTMPVEKFADLTGGKSTLASGRRIPHFEREPMALLSFSDCKSRAFKAPCLKTSRNLSLGGMGGLNNRRHGFSENWLAEAAALSLDVGMENNFSWLVQVSRQRRPRYAPEAPIMHLRRAFDGLEDQV